MTQRETFQDLLQERGVDLDAIARDREILESGCVIRSLESVTNQRATDEEMDLRLRTLRESPTFVQIISDSWENPRQGRAKLRQALRQDHQQIKTLIRDLRAHDTPLGKVLQSQEVKFVYMNTGQIHEILRDGKKAIVCGALHACHVEIGSGETLISKSDGDLPMAFDKESYWTITFKESER
ncbi:hypothetical protein ISS85_02730 [Candidatus Microgenomates bacterium]|nr:hypothetical protein [Candidatus Microgenomates bacterium]